MRYGRPLDDLYFEWLVDMVSVDEDSIHPNALKTMYKTPFEPFVPNDQNRAEDGLVVRQEFALGRSLGTIQDREWLSMECSIFEMLVGLADRVAFQTGWDFSEWFWIFVDNLGITKGIPVESALRKLNRRTYAANGEGGLFPLQDPKEDQRKVEIWYQMSAYLLENIEY